MSAPISTPAGLAPVSCANPGPGFSMFLSHHSPCSKFTKAAFQLLLNQWIYPRNVMNNYTLPLPLSLLELAIRKKLPLHFAGFVNTNAHNPNVSELTASEWSTQILTH